MCFALLFCLFNLICLIISMFCFVSLFCIVVCLIDFGVLFVFVMFFVFGFVRLFDILVFALFVSLIPSDL